MDFVHHTPRIPSLWTHLKIYSMAYVRDHKGLHQLVLRWFPHLMLVFCSFTCEGGLELHKRAQDPAKMKKALSRVRVVGWEATCNTWAAAFSCLFMVTFHPYFEYRTPWENKLWNTPLLSEREIQNCRMFSASPRHKKDVKPIAYRKVPGVLWINVHLPAHQGHKASLLANNIPQWTGLMSGHSKLSSCSVNYFCQWKHLTLYSDMGQIIEQLMWSDTCTPRHIYSWESGRTFQFYRSLGPQENKSRWCFCISLQHAGTKSNFLLRNGWGAVLLEHLQHAFMEVLKSFILQAFCTK